MNLQAKKLELMSQLIYVEDECLVKKALQKMSIPLKTKQVSHPIPLKFGAAKDMIQDMAEDFNEPIDDFKEYM